MASPFNNLKCSAYGEAAQNCLALCPTSCTRNYRTGLRTHLLPGPLLIPGLIYFLEITWAARLTKSAHPLGWVKRHIRSVICAGNRKRENMAVANVVGDRMARLCLDSSQADDTFDNKSSEGDSLDARGRSLWNRASPLSSEYCGRTVGVANGMDVAGCDTLDHSVVNHQDKTTIHALLCPLLYARFISSDITHMVNPYAQGQVNYTVYHNPLKSRS
jgi:hypothetical protein